MDLEAQLAVGQEIHCGKSCAVCWIHIRNMNFVVAIFTKGPCLTNG